MNVRFFRQDPEAEREVLAVFGEARLVKLFCGRLELRGGSAADCIAAKEWISLFMHEAVPRILVDHCPTT
jgi:hypothetical protein